MVLSCKFFVPQSALQAGFHPRERRTNCATKDNNKQNNNVMMKKSFYETPESELIVVRFEEAFLQGTGYNPNNHTQYLKGVNSEDDYEEL